MNDRSAQTPGAAPPRPPAYYAVLPSRIRYDDRLSPNAKLLYAEISALTEVTGYCFASNSYFSTLYGLSERTIQRLLAQLQDCGYIVIERLQTDVSTPDDRRIYAGMFPALPSTAPDSETDVLPDEAPEGGDNFVAPVRQNCHRGGDKNVTHNNTSINNTPLKPPQGGRRNRTPKSQPDWKPERFAGFWAFYPRGESKQAAIRAWDALKPDDALIDTMAQALVAAKATESWQSGIGIPYASTWINQRRWEDEHRETAAQQPSGWAEDPEVYT